MPLVTGFADKIVFIPAVNIHTSIYDAFGYFRTYKNYSMFPVVNNEIKPTGLICERTLKDYTYGMFGRELIKRHSLNEFITPHVQVDIGSRVEDVLSVYAANPAIDGILVVDSDGRYSGVLPTSKLAELYEENRKHINRQLLQTQKLEAIGTLAGGIAHDFNNILMPIMGYAELISKIMPSDKNEKIDFYTDQILKAGGRAQDLVKQILAFSRQNEQTRSAFRLEFIIKEALKLLRASLPSTISLEFEVTAVDDMVFADPTQIHQILMNLCTNAAYELNGNNGILRVSLANPEGLDIPGFCDHAVLPESAFIRLSVSDSAGSLDASIIHRIFEPFFTTKPLGKGTGLGLAVVHGIVKSHGGFISIETIPARQTTFHVFLPLYRNQSANTASANPGPDRFRGKGIRVLLIDDEVEIVNFLQESLEMMNFHITPHTNSLEAFNRFATQPEAFDIVVTDQTMPGLTGAEMARRMLGLRPSLPIIICTGFSEQVSVEHAKAIGIREYLLKPITAESLASHLVACLSD